MPPYVAQKELPTITPSVRRTFRRALADWYGIQRRNLPWRHTRDPYAIWVSEVMLQQTQVKTVLPYYARFMAQFPSVADLARADLPDVLKSWEGMGYYARARNLHKASRIVVGQFNGRIPSQWSTLRALPGIGEYIAAAVLSIAFNRPHAVLDGNVKRVLTRLFLIDAPVNQAAAHKHFRDLAEQLMDRKNPGDHNQAMMELGAVRCTPRQPLCPQCPVAKFCGALHTNTIRSYPRRAKRARVPQVSLVGGLVWKKGRVLLTRRPLQGLLGGLWEFVNDPVVPGQDPAATLVKHIKKAVNLDVRVQRRVAAVRHAYTHFKVQMEVYDCQWLAGRVRLNGPAEYAWVRPDALHDYALHGAVHKALKQFNQLHPTEA